MEYHRDLYGVPADQETFLDHEEALIDPIADRLVDVLDVDLEGCYSESRGGICYNTALDDEVDEPELDIHLHPNHIIESDGDYWLEEKHKEFALLLSIGTQEQTRIEEIRKVLQEDTVLNLTLIRTIHYEDLDQGSPRNVVFSLDPQKIAE